MTAPNNGLNIVCVYTGIPGDCSECGGHDATGTGWCSHDCRQAFEGRGAQIRANIQARRDADDAFGREADRLRSVGHTDEEIDEMLKEMP
jgi:hypothetical protein